MLKKINNVKIKPYKFEDADNKESVGKDMFNLYKNVLITARKKSGKTVLIGRILEHMANKYTDVFILCPTVKIDITYKNIIEDLEKKGITVSTYEEINATDKTNNIEIIIEHMKETLDEERQEEEDKKNKVKEEKPDIVEQFKNGIQKHEEVKKRQRRPKKISNRFIIVIDDMAHQINDSYVEALLKNSRHYHAMVLISNQTLVGIPPNSRKQIEHALILGGFKKDALRNFFNDLDLNISFDEFMELYKSITSVKYNFLNIDVRNCEYKKNFNYEIKISNE